MKFKLPFSGFSFTKSLAKVHQVKLTQGSIVGKRAFRTNEKFIQGSWSPAARWILRLGGSFFLCSGMYLTANQLFAQADDNNGEEEEGPKERSRPLTQEEVESLKNHPDYQRFRELLELQEKAFKIKLYRELKAQEEALSKSYQKQVRQYLIKAQAEMREEFEQEKERFEEQLQNELNEKLSFKQREIISDHVERLGIIRVLNSQVQAHEEIFKTLIVRDEISLQIHQLYSSLSHISQALRKRQPFFAEATKMKVVARDDEFISTLLEAIPLTAMERGIYTMDQLRNSFDANSSAFRKALTPKGSSLLGGYVISLIESFKIPTKPTLDGDLISQASYFLHEGDLEASLSILEPLPSKPKELDLWIQVAKERILVEGIVSVLDAHLRLKAQTLQ